MAWCSCMRSRCTRPSFQTDPPSSLPSCQVHCTTARECREWAAAGLLGLWGHRAEPHYGQLTVPSSASLLLRYSPDRGGPETYWNGGPYWVHHQRSTVCGMWQRLPPGRWLCPPPLHWASPQANQVWLCWDRHYIRNPLFVLCRYNTTWRAELAAVLPQLANTNELVPDDGQMSEEMNVAFAWHEIDGGEQARPWAEAGLA